MTLSDPTLSDPTSSIYKRSQDATKVSITKSDQLLSIGDQDFTMRPNFGGGGGGGSPSCYTALTQTFSKAFQPLFNTCYCAFTPNPKGRHDSIQSQPRRESRQIFPRENPRQDCICSATLLTARASAFWWICSATLSLELNYFNFAATFA